jgi:hypothetical protein
MNMKGNQENEQPYMSQNSNSNANLNHSKSHIDPSSFIQNNTKTPTNNTTTSRLQNPRILEKKFNIGAASNGPKQVMSGENSN